MMKTKAQSHKMIVTVLVILISCFFVNTVNCNPQGNNTRKQQERAILVNSVDDERGFIFLKKKLHDQNDVIIYSVNQQGLADYGVSESMGQHKLINIIWTGPAITTGKLMLKIMLANKFLHWWMI